MVYGAGLTGFGPARALGRAGVRCEVAAPSKLHRPAGDLVKTDAWEALLLARLLRLDEIVPFRVPTPSEDAARDLVRSREEARGDLMRSRHRPSKLLLRRGIVFSGGKEWTNAHGAWLATIPLDSAATRCAFDADHDAVLMATARRDRLDGAITAMAFYSEFTPIVRRLSCLRGVSTLTAFALAVEIGQWDRFTGATIGAYLGQVPSEHPSGASRSQGPITKSGKTHARRLLEPGAGQHALSVQGRTARAPVRRA